MVTQSDVVRTSTKGSVSANQCICKRLSTSHKSEPRWERQYASAHSGTFEHVASFILRDARVVLTVLQGAVAISASA
jgi:hypothetical protein